MNRRERPSRCYTVTEKSRAPPLLRLATSRSTHRSRYSRKSRIISMRRKDSCSPTSMLRLHVRLRSRKSRWSRYASRQILLRRFRYPAALPIRMRPRRSCRYLRDVIPLYLAIHSPRQTLKQRSMHNLAVRLSAPQIWKSTSVQKSPQASNQKRIANPPSRNTRATALCAECVTFLSKKTHMTHYRAP